MMTRTEAKKKWCPAALGSPKSAGVEPRGDAFFECECIADDCMMWRWCDHDEGCTVGKCRHDCPKQAHQGYCGLGGIPCA